MTDETETNTEEEKPKDHNGRSDIGTGNIPTIEKLPDSLKETIENKQSVIRQGKSPLYTNGRASRTAMTNLMIT